MKSELTLFALLLGLGFLPLLGGPRYEAALVAGLLTPSWVAVTAAIRLRQRLWQEGDLHGRSIVWRALLDGASHAVVLIAAATIIGLSKGFCEPREGYALMLLGPSMGMLLAAVLGAAAGLLSRKGSGRTHRAVLLALLAPILSALLSIIDFYHTPAVYAFDTFVGYFAGPLYDTVVYDFARLLELRVTTLCWLLALGLSLSSLRFSGDPQRGVVVVLTTAGWLFAAVPFLGLGVMRTLHSGQLGLRATPKRVDRELPHRALHGPCVVQYASGVEAARARELAGQCAGHVRQIRSYFGLAGTGERIRVLLFESEEQKWQVMGARSTFIAKPWRREIYLQNEPFPHPVLGHELAHVIAGEFGRGPFRIAGSWGGLLPDPGRIEGFAVAAAPAEFGEASTRQWALAMEEQGLLPPVRQLFSLGFLGNSAVRSYTASGAFIEYLHERGGPELLRRFYRGEDLPTLSGASYSELDRAFRSWLRRTSLPDSVRLIAREVFSRPAVWGRRCPHAASRALAQAHALCANEPEQIEKLVLETLRLDGTRQDERILPPLCLLQAQRDESGRSLGELVLSRADVSERAKARLESALADLDFRTGHLAQAEARYVQLLSGALTAEERRAVEIKLWALGQGGRTQLQIQKLVSVGATTQDERPRLSDVERYYEESFEPVLGYLLGLWSAEKEPERSLDVLGRVIHQDLPSSSLMEEAQRRRLLVACRLGRLEVVDEASRWLIHHAERETSKLLAERLPWRCEEMQKR